jgi:hypothetical protein
MIDHGANRLDRHSLSNRIAQIDEEQREPLCAFGDLLERGSTNQEEEEVRMLNA